MSIEISTDDYDRYHEIYAWDNDKSLCAVLKLHEFLIGNLFFEVIAFGFYSPDLNSYLTDYGLIVNKQPKIYFTRNEVESFMRSIEIYNGRMLMGAGYTDGFGIKQFGALEQKVKEAQVTAAVY